MTLTLAFYATSDGGKQISIADNQGDTASTLVVFSETDVDSLTSGQFTVLHDVAKGDAAGQWNTH